MAYCLFFFKSAIVHGGLLLLFLGMASYMHIVLFHVCCIWGTFWLMYVATTMLCRALCALYTGDA